MLVVDRTKARLPNGYSLWQIIFTYGGQTRVNVLVSAETKRKAIDEVKETYSYLNPKMLSIEYIDSDTERIYDRTKELILGKLFAVYFYII